MEQKVFHGEIVPADLARGLMAHFNRGNYHVQQVGEGSQLVVQVATKEFRSAGGQTAVSVNLQAIEDGVAVSIGKQAWLGVAASLGATVFAAIQNPINILSRLDDLAQDIESLQITEEVWKVIEETAQSVGASYEMSEKLRRLECGYCGTANPVGEPSCIACGAPLGDEQPSTCRKCGYVLRNREYKCPNCGTVQ
jgi:hypothetical protein